MVTLYLEVEESRDRRPGVEQKMSVGHNLATGAVAEEAGAAKLANVA